MRRHGSVIAHCTDSEDFPNKVKDLINYYCIKHHAWVRYSTRHINEEKYFNYLVDINKPTISHKCVQHLDYRCYISGFSD